MATEVAQDLVSLTIDGVPLRVPKGTLLVEAAKQIKQEIPVYCYHTKLGPAGLCRVCLVEIEGMPKLQIACNTPVADGMVVHTQNDKVNSGRSMILELLLVNHPLDCPICDKGGECDLQDYAMAYGPDASQNVDPKTSKPKAVDLGPTIVLDEERCVVCQRCVRFDDIIAKERQLVLKDRGARDIIATATGDAYSHNFTGNVTELCPVGALTSKTYRFKSRPWDLKRTQTSCTQCSVGCQMFSDTRLNVPLRTMSVEADDTISDGWLCDRGRYNIGFYQSPERITQPLLKHEGQWVQISWDDAFEMWSKAIGDAKAAGKPVGAIGGARLTNEEAYLLGHVFRAIGTNDIDWRAGTQRQATPLRHGGTFEDLERAQAVIVLGASPEERAPIAWLRALKAVTKNDAKVVRIAPQWPAPNVPYEDVMSVKDALAAVPTDARVAILWDGVNTAIGAELREAVQDRGNVCVIIANEQGNARGADAMGALPHGGGASAASMLGDGSQYGVLSLFGVNPVRNGADPAAAAAALDAASFVVVADLFMTETAQRANLVLPVLGAFEKNGTMINMTGDLLPLNASLPAPDNVLSDLEIFVGLARAVNVVLPSVEELEATVIRLAADAQKQFSYGDVDLKPVVSSIAERSIFDGGGTSAFDDRIAALRQAQRDTVETSGEVAKDAVGQ